MTHPQPTLFLSLCAHHFESTIQPSLVHAHASPSIYLAEVFNHVGVDGLVAAVPQLLFFLFLSFLIRRAKGLPNRRWESGSEWDDDDAYKLATSSCFHDDDVLRVGGVIGEKGALVFNGVIPPLSIRRKSPDTLN